MAHFARLLFILGLLILGANCSASLDEVIYRCDRNRRFSAEGDARETGYPYVEEFDDDDGDEGLTTLRDRCWQTYDTQAANVLPSDGDLIIRPNKDAFWSAKKRAPSVSQHLVRDFVLVTRAEVVNSSTADHCNLADDDVAGLVVRRDESPAGWLTFTVRPFGVTPNNCLDNAAMPPNAVVERKGYGLGIVDDSGVNATRENVGEDGEADIALCRQADRLVTFYRDPAMVPPWREVGPVVEIGPGSLEVGLTTATRDGDPVEGHFSWAVFQWIGTLPGDGCAGALESFVPPPEPDEEPEPTATGP